MASSEVDEVDVSDGETSLEKSKCSVIREMMRDTVLDGSAFSRRTVCQWGYFISGTE
jgi:hypothetical protein